MKRSRIRLRGAYGGRGDDGQVAEPELREVVRQRHVPVSNHREREPASSEARNRAGRSGQELEPQRLGRVSQLVGYHESGEQEQSRLADLPDALHEFRDLGIYILAEASDTRLLPVIAGDHVWPAVDRQADLSHLTPLPPRCARSLRERRRRARRSRRQSPSAPDHRFGAC